MLLAFAGLVFKVWWNTLIWSSATFFALMIWSTVYDERVVQEFVGKIFNAVQLLRRSPRMRKFATAAAAVIVMILSLAAVAQGQKSVPAWPAGLDTARYPIFHKVEVMSAVKMADMGLHPVRLKKATVVWNWTEARKRFLPDTLQAGVIVAADSAEQPVYKADCTNRLASFPGASVLPMERIDSTASRLLAGDSANRLVGAANRSGLGSWFSNAAGAIWGFLWGLLKFLGALILLLVLLALFLAMVLGLVEFLRDIWRQRGIPTNPPTPTVTPFVATPPSGAAGGATNTAGAAGGATGATSAAGTAEIFPPIPPASEGTTPPSFVEHVSMDGVRGQIRYRGLRGVRVMMEDDDEVVVIQYVQ